MIIGILGATSITTALYYFAVFWPVNLAILIVLAAAGAVPVGLTGIYGVVAEMDKATIALSAHKEARNINRYGGLLVFLLIISVIVGLSGYAMDYNQHFNLLQDLAVYCSYYHAWSQEWCCGFTSFDSCRARASRTYANSVFS